MQNILKSVDRVPSFLIFLLKFAITGKSIFYDSMQVFIFQKILFLKIVIGILIVIALNQCITFGRMNILILLIIPIHYTWSLYIFSAHSMTFNSIF